jgi:segregation and condensation protein B
MDYETLGIEETNGHAPHPAAIGDDPADAAVVHRPAEDRPARTPLDDVGELPAVLESLLFAAGASVTLGRLVDALGGPGRAEVLRGLEVLQAEYERSGRGLRLVQVAGGYQLRSAPQHAAWVRRLLQERPPRLSRPMLETLAIVAYRQPCTRVEIEAVRGVDCDAVLSTLTERRLVKITGRKEAPGRPLLYGTTREFLEVFGLQDLSGLPTLRELGDGAELLAAPDLTVTDAGVVPTEPRTESETEPETERGTGAGLATETGTGEDG